MPGGMKIKMTLLEKSEECAVDVERLLGPILRNEVVQHMRSFIQHGDVSTYEHCLNVAKCSLYLARKWKWKVDERALTEGAFLHDFYLYDWHVRKRAGRKHGFCHTALAAKNAREQFGVDDKVYYIIRTHMFPLTLFWPPRSREGWLVCFADKYCAARETSREKKNAKT